MITFLIRIYHYKVSQTHTGNTFLYDVILYNLYKRLFYMTLNQFYILGLQDLYLEI